MLASLLAILLHRAQILVQKLPLMLLASLHPCERCDRCGGTGENAWERGVLD